MRTLSVDAAQVEFAAIIAEIQATGERLEITKNGERAAVILNADDYDSLIETIDVLCEPRILENLQQSRVDSEAGDVFSLEDVKAELLALGRLK